MYAHVSHVAATNIDEESSDIGKQRLLELPSRLKGMGFRRLADELMPNSSVASTTMVLSVSLTVVMKMAIVGPVAS